MDKPPTKVGVLQGVVFPACVAPETSELSPTRTAACRNAAACGVREPRLVARTTYLWMLTDQWWPVPRVPASAGGPVQRARARRSVTGREDRPAEVRTFDQARTVVQAAMPGAEAATYGGQGATHGHVPDGMAWWAQVRS